MEHPSRWTSLALVASTAVLSAAGCSGKGRPDSLAIGGPCAHVPLAVVRAVAPTVTTGRYTADLAPEEPANCWWSDSASHPLVTIDVITANADKIYQFAASHGEPAGATLSGTGAPATLLSRAAVAAGNTASVTAYLPTARVTLTVLADPTPPTDDQLRALLAPAVTAYQAAVH